MAFEPGEVVMLKSGGQSMTVASVSDDDVTCLWTGASGQLFREIIPAVALESVSSLLDDDEDDEDEELEDDEVEDDDESADEDDEEDAPRGKTRAR
jgi:uncharacterized protein YodC (DUF2158 family)